MIKKWNEVRSWSLLHVYHIIHLNFLNSCHCCSRIQWSCRPPPIQDYLRRTSTCYSCAHQAAFTSQAFIQKWHHRLNWCRYGARTGSRCRWLLLANKWTRIQQYPCSNCRGDHRIFYSGMLYTREEVCGRLPISSFLFGFRLTIIDCRGIHDLKSYVTDEEYDRLINFMYLETKEEVDKFSAWVRSLTNPKVQGTCTNYVLIITKINDVFPLSLVGPQNQK